MAYIGKQPQIGNYIKLDAITTSATATYNLLAGGVAVYPQTATNCIVSLNGIIQAPTDAYTISGSTIVFASALTTSDVIDFITVLGDVLNIGTPSDGTVGIAKLSATGTPSSTTFLRGDNTWGSAGATAGQVIQVVSATDSTERSSSAGSFVTASNTLSASITPASTSNKILILCSTQVVTNGDQQSNTTIYRDSTNLGNSTEGMSRVYGYGSHANMNFVCMTYLDSPSSTSSLTYQFYFKSSGGYFNYAGTKGSITVLEIKG